ncbi:MAG: aminotransferase class I/II-fold pyridoxal phosphate-dependent enzyme, partial [Bacteroidota bacterium]
MFYAVQQAAVEALGLPDEWYKELNTIYSRRRKIVEAIFDILNCTYSKESGGLFVWAKIPENTKDAESLSEMILHQAHVFITPGFIFGKNGERYLRISLSSEEENLKEAKSRIQNIKIK